MKIESDVKGIRRKDWSSLPPTLEGWGVNDVNYNISRSHKFGDTWRVTWTCPYYVKWTSIIKRALSEKCKSHRNAYLGVSICTEWKYLSNFIYWVDQQENKNWKECEPDKDFLSKDNKIYSPETVVFIPQNLNAFIISTKKRRGKYKIGVSYHHKPGKDKPFVSRCSDPFTGKDVYLGVFSTEIEAHLAWKAYKHKLALKYASMGFDERVNSILLTRFAPESDWTTA